jgi:hypothetical protein
MVKRIPILGQQTLCCPLGLLDPQAQAWGERLPGASSVAALILCWLLAASTWGRPKSRLPCLCHRGPYLDQSQHHCKKPGRPPSFRSSSLGRHVFNAKEDACLNQITLIFWALKINKDQRFKCNYYSSNSPLIMDPINLMCLKGS